MKQVVMLFLIVIPILLCLGCGVQDVADDKLADSKITKPPPKPTRQPRVVQPTPSLVEATIPGVPIASEPERVIDPLSDPNSLLAKRKIYFSFDVSEIRQEFRDIIMAHAGYLADHPELRITIEGHADERGTREYNLALGERRAKAVEQLLALQGAEKDQIRLVSFGEEKLDVEGHDEFSWEMNRRAIIIYP